MAQLTNETPSGDLGQRGSVCVCVCVCGDWSVNEDRCMYIKRKAECCCVLGQGLEDRRCTVYYLGNTLCIRLIWVIKHLLLIIEMPF